MKRRFWGIAGLGIGGGLLLLLGGIGVSGVDATPDTWCADIEFVWVRGSGQEMGTSEEWLAYKEKMNNELVWEDVMANYVFWEIDYPAIEVDIQVGIKAIMSAGAAGEYGESVQEGVRNLQNHVKRQSAGCPNEKFVLAGYSQGAQVVAESLAGLDSGKVLYAALLGEPKTYLPEGLASWLKNPNESPMPDACRGYNLSEYRAWAPDCWTHAGVLSGRRPYVAQGWEGKVGLYCNRHDFICGSSAVPLKNAGHGEYAERMSLVASDAVAKVVGFFPSIEAIGGWEDMARKRPPMDVVFLVDSKGGDAIEEILGRYSEWAEDLAGVLERNGGRTAMIEYRKVEDAGFPKILCDFDCASKEIGQNMRSRQIAKREFYGDVSNMYSALMTAYEDLGWRDDSEKAVIVVSEDTRAYLSDKISSNTVIKKSLDMGVVSTFYAYDGEGNYQNTIQWRTGGKNLSWGGWASASNKDILANANFTELHDYILRRPVAKLAMDTYAARVGESMFFDAGGSYGVGSGIVWYHWDMNADGMYEGGPVLNENGVYERRRGINEVEWSYWYEYEGYAVLRVVAEDESAGMAVAKVRVSDAPVKEPAKAPRELSLTRTGIDTARAEWVAESAYVAVGVDGVLIGYAMGASGGVNITDFRPGMEVWLAGVSEEWEFGERVVIGDEGEGEMENAVEDGVDEEEVEEKSGATYEQIVGRLPKVELGPTLSWLSQGEQVSPGLLRRDAPRNDEIIDAPRNDQTAVVSRDDKGELVVPDTAEVRKTAWWIWAAGGLTIVAGVGAVREVIVIKRQKMLK